MKSSKRQTVERNEENCSKCESRNEINKKGKLEIKNLGIQIGTSESSLTSRIQEIEGGISFIEDKIEKNGYLGERNGKSKKKNSGKSLQGI